MDDVYPIYGTAVVGISSTCCWKGGLIEEGRVAECVRVRENQRVCQSNLSDRQRIERLCRRRTKAPDVLLKHEYRRDTNRARGGVSAL